MNLNQLTDKWGLNMIYGTENLTVPGEKTIQLKANTNEDWFIVSYRTDETLVDIVDAALTERHSLEQANKDKWSFRFAWLFIRFHLHTKLPEIYWRDE